MDFVYPRRCVVCHGILEWDEKIHATCKQRIFPVGKEVCFHCGRPVKNAQTEYCYDCMKIGHASYFQQGRSLYLYRGSIKQSMYRFKYSNCREYATFFAKMAQQHQGDWIQSIAPDVIVPVPMYRPKMQARGYNQAESFARALSKCMGIAVDTHLVYRVKDTTAQKELDDLQRKNNLKNAFQCQKNVVKYKKILLVDDIYTTGSTAEEVSRSLLGAAEEIYFLSICIGKGF